jgi:hypothetical protein
MRRGVQGHECLSAVWPPAGSASLLFNAEDKAFCMFFHDRFDYRAGVIFMSFDKDVHPTHPGSGPQDDASAAFGDGARNFIPDGQLVLRRKIISGPSHKDPQLTAVESAVALTVLITCAADRCKHDQYKKDGYSHLSFLSDLWENSTLCRVLTGQCGKVGVQKHETQWNHGRFFE